MVPYPYNINYSIKIAKQETALHGYSGEDLWYQEWASIASEEQFAADMHALSGYCCSSAVLSSRLPHDWVLSVYM